MRSPFRSSPVVVLLFVAAIAGVAAAAPLGNAPDSRTVLALQLVDEMKTLARELPADSFERGATFAYAAQFDFLLGRRAAFEKYVQELEEAAAQVADPRQRLQNLCGAASCWAVVDPDRARRLIAQVEQAIAALPDKADDMKVHLHGPYLQLGDYRRAVESYQAHARVDPRITLFTYGRLGQVCFTRGEAEAAAEVAKAIRAVEPKPDDLDPKWKVDFVIEQYRVDALAKCGLADEAAALYEWCWATGASFYDVPGSLQDVAWSYVQAGKPEKARAFVRKHLAHIRPDLKIVVVRAAAEAGDYALVDELLAGASAVTLMDRLCPLIVMAHRAGDFKTRDVWLARYHKALADRPKNEEFRTHLYGVSFEVPLVDAAIGRYDPALAMLPKLKGGEACAVRIQLVELMLRDQKKQFGRSPFARIEQDLLGVDP